jgi:predicted Na+-dependent transporter
LTIDQWINLLASITLFELRLAIGLGVTIADVASVVTNGRLVAQAALANDVVVPLSAAGLLLWFRPRSLDPGGFPLIAAGFLIAESCPGAPFSPPFTRMAGGNVVVLVGLMVIVMALVAMVWGHWATATEQARRNTTSLPPPMSSLANGSQS